MPLTKGNDYRDYLGDGVYVRFDGYSIVLYLDNGYGEHTTIALEPEVLAALDRYRKSMERILK